jgi:hypothetical protein
MFLQLFTGHRLPFTVYDHFRYANFCTIFASFLYKFNPCQDWH